MPLWLDDAAGPRTTRSAEESPPGRPASAGRERSWTTGRTPRKRHMCRVLRRASLELNAARVAGLHAEAPRHEEGRRHDRLSIELRDHVAGLDARRCGRATGHDSG